MKWQKTGFRVPIQRADGGTDYIEEEAFGAETECCDIRIKHWHCSCGAPLHLFPITEGHQEVGRSVYAFAAADWHQYRFEKATVHDVVDPLGTLLQRGRHDREYPTLDPRPAVWEDERPRQPLSL